MKLALYILLALLAACTFVQTKAGTDYTMPIRICLFGGAMLFMGLVIAAYRDRIDLSIVKRLIFPAFLCYFAIALLSIVFAIDKGGAFYEALKIYLMMISLFCFVVVLQDHRDTVIKFMVLISLVTVIYGIYQYFTIESMMNRRGFMANKNLAASAHLLTVPFCLYVMKYKKWRIVALISLAGIMFCVLTLHSRAVFLASLIMAIIISLKKRIIIPFVLIGFAAAILLTRASVFDTSTLIQRTEIWKQTLKMSKDNPLGIGAGNFMLRIPEYIRYMDKGMREICYQEFSYTRTHNDPLQVLSEMGILGFSFYIIIFGFALYYARNQIYWLAGICGFMVVACFSFLRERPHHSIILILLIAIPLSMYHKPLKFHPEPKKVYIVSVIALGLLMVAVYVFGMRFRADLNVHDILMARKKGDWHTVRKKTRHYSWLAMYDCTGTPIDYYRGLASSFLGEIPLAVEHLEKAREANPNHLYTLGNLGAIYFRIGRLEEAQECYTKAVWLFPEYQKTKDDLAVVNKVSTFIEERQK